MSEEGPRKTKYNQRKVNKAEEGAGVDLHLSAVGSKANTTTTRGSLRYTEPHSILHSHPAAASVATPKM